ncbi:MAG: transglutaminase family protein, partial [Flavobacteriaceae bacterium]|nr:transglutaminase family protein [Flavobacteriaceae bacterium]
MKNYTLLFIVYLSTLQIHSQNSTDFNIPVSLSENADAIVKEHTEKIEIKSQQKLVHQISRKIIVLNEKGKNYVNAYLYYDDDCTIKNLEAKVYNMSGLELKKITKKDFKDIAVDDGFSLQLEGRIKYLEYTPTSYPYMVNFTSTYETTNTAFIPRWIPFDNYNVSIEKSSIEINYDTTLGFRFLEKNFDRYVILKELTANNVKYELRDLPAQKAEPYGISSSENFPEVLFAVNNFHLKGVNGYATTWNELGAWFYEKLYKTQTDLSPETILKIKALTENAKTPIEKAQIVYKYVQDKTRYISIQLGIGGWKPMQAKDVDKLGYGDCKALTNYTHSLLKVVGVESYLTLIQSDNNKIGLEKDFPSMQGNHMILCIPSEENIFLECTSQKIPFGYIGQSNEDREVLIITPEGGKMVKTNKYKTQENLLKTYANVIVDNQGNAKTELSRVFSGAQLDY